MEATQVYKLNYEKQNEYFVNFLHWLKTGNHKQEGSQRAINNGTCNAFLEDVFRFYFFVEAEYEQFGSLKAEDARLCVVMGRVAGTGRQGTVRLGQRRTGSLYRGAGRGQE